MLPTLQQKLRVMELNHIHLGPASDPMSVRSTSDDSPKWSGAQNQPNTHEWTDHPSTIALVHDFQEESRQQHDRSDAANSVAYATAEALAGTAGCNLLVPRSVVAAAAADDSAFDDPPEQLTELIREIQRKDAFVEDHKRGGIVDAGQEGAEERPATTRRPHEGYAFDAEDLLRFEGKIYVPNSSALKEELLRRNHDDPVAGHYGRARTHEVLARKYHWPNLSKDVKEYVSSCDVCQRIKSKHHKPYGELQPLQVPERPWKCISMDFVTGLLESIEFSGKVYDSVLVIVDRFLKIV